MISKSKTLQALFNRVSEAATLRSTFHKETYDIDEVKHQLQKQYHYFVSRLSSFKDILDNNSSFMYHYLHTICNAKDYAELTNPPKLKNYRIIMNNMKDISYLI